MRTPQERRDDEPAFVLHSYPYRDEHHRRGADFGAWTDRAGGARSAAPAFRAARRLAGVPAAGAFLERCGRAEDAGQGRVARRTAARDRVRIAVRLLLERAAVEAAAARGPASNAVRRLRGGTAPARVRRAAGTCAARIRGAAARGNGLRDAADARGGHGEADRSARAVLLRVRSRAAYHGGRAGPPLSGGAWNDAARAGAARLQRARSGGGGQAADARGARLLSRAPYDR